MTQGHAGEPPHGQVGRPRLAFVGLGWWGGELAKAVERSGAAEVAACFARTVESRQAFAAAHGCEAAGDLDDLLSDDGIDALVLATPHSTHLPLIRAAADAGKHVFVEKPLTVSLAEAEEAVAVARAAGIVLQVGHHRRRVAATRVLRRHVDRGAFGLLHLLEAKQTTPSDLQPRGGWRGDPAECPLGGMTALGVHMVDTIHYLAGQVREVYATSRRLLGRGALDDITTLSLDLASGALATLSTSVVLPREATIAVHGHDGSGWSERDGAELYLQSPAQPHRERHDVDAVDAVAEQMREFAGCVRSGKDPETAGEQGRDVVAVLEAARYSADERRPVPLAEVRGT
ncbi:MAG TPA: Gfo/Idh/MocA family oxidoreductase [Euzebyales bacterium]|nr:Gfo/Idh/MocA family oxidoreductase [Euzebyales bacterium]